MKTPLVSVVILSYNRQSELSVTLDKVFSQGYQNIEVIVADNASTDGTREMITERFPRVRLIAMPFNAGCAGWSAGFAAAAGEFIVVLDDNAYPHHDAITRCVEFFRLESSSSIACVAFNMMNLSTGRLWESNWQPKDRSIAGTCSVFVGCGYMLDVKKISTTGLMPDHYFMFQIELPVAAAIHNSGFRIYYHPEIIGYHWFYERKGYNQWQERLVFQNNLFFIIESLPLMIVIPYALQSILYFFTRSIRHQWFIEFAGTVFKVLGHFRRKGPISWTYFFELRKLQLFNFSLISKFTLRRRSHAGAQ